MNKLLKSIIISFCLIITISLFAGVNYYVIVDAGSSGSRIHMYRIETTNNNEFNVIEEIDIPHNKVKPGLSAMAGDKTQIVNYIKPLITSLTSTLKDKNIPEEDVHFYLLATAGMRITPPSTQQSSYLVISEYIKNNTKLKIGYIETIPGKYEGAFDFISTNYLLKNLAKNKRTKGIIDMGGESVEIAFQTHQKLSNNNDIITFKINNLIYRIYSKSYLGLGQDAVRAQYSNAPYCFPKGYLLPNGEYANGDYEKCLKEINNLINNVHEVDQTNVKLPSIREFIGLSGIYYIAGTPFNLGSELTINQIIEKGKEFSKLEWEKLSYKYPSNPYLFSVYINSAYIADILSNGFGFEKNIPFKVYDKIDGISSDWTLGAAIFFDQNNKIQSLEKQAPVQKIEQEQKVG